MWVQRLPTRSAVVLGSELVNFKSSHTLAIRQTVLADYLFSVQLGPIVKVVEGNQAAIESAHSVRLRLVDLN